MPPKIYTIADAAEATGLPNVTIRDRLARNPHIGRRTVGGTVILSETDLRRIVKAAGKRGRPRLKNAENANE